MLQSCAEQQSKGELEIKSLSVGSDPIACGIGSHWLWDRILQQGGSGIGSCSGVGSDPVRQWDRFLGVSGDGWIGMGSDPGSGVITLGLGLS